MRRDSTDELMTRRHRPHRAFVQGGSRNPVGRATEITVTFFCISVAAIGLSSCGNYTTLHEPVTVDHVGEAGTVLLSVNSTIPWSEAEAELDPKFTLVSGDAALEKVVRTTAALRRQVLDAFGIGLGIGLEQTGTTATETKTMSEKTETGDPDNTASQDQAVTTERTTSEVFERKPGVAPDAPSTAPSGPALPQQIDGGDATGVDPFLEYKAAQSLYQYVKLLNAEVRNAAVRKGYVPHVVMLKLTPMLYRRDLSYDIHSTISFFHANQASPPGGRLPYVVPILATDNLERAIKSSAVEVSRQFGVALNALISGTGANLNLDKLNRNLQAIEASDFNSLLTVGRLTDNSLYIRLGAANQATARFAAVGKTYDIATLVLVPQEYYSTKKDCNTQGEDPKAPTLSIISHTDLRNAFTGEQLDQVPQNIQIKKYDESLRSVLKTGKDAWSTWKDKTPDEKIKSVNNLASMVQQSKWKGFLNAVKKETGICKIPKKYYKSLWHTIAGITAESSFKSASVQLRPLQPLTIPRQTAVLRDYGATGMEVVLRNVSGAQTNAVIARLVYASGEVFPAETITVVPDAQLLRLGFVSTKLWKLDPVASTLYVEASTCHWGKACPKNDLQESYPVVYLTLPQRVQAQPKLSLRQTLKVIVADKGKGGTTIFIDNLKEDRVALTIEGARIVSAKDGNDKPISVSQQRVILSADTSVDLSLDNLRPGENVIVKATGLKMDLDTKKLTPTGSKQAEFEVVKAE